MCGLRDRPGVRGPRRCLWYKGDSHGVYQIIGPGMDKKLMYKQGCQDLYLAPRLRYLREDEDVYAMLDSLRRMIALEPKVLFCQHRGRVENGAALLQSKLDFLTELGERIHELHKHGLDQAAIARTLPGSDWVWRTWTSGHFSKAHFVRAFLRAHGQGPS